MPISLNLYHDQISASVATSAPMPAASRLLYIRHGRVEINDRQINGGEAMAYGHAVTMKSAGEWCHVWRWELAPPNAAPALLKGEGVFSSLRMSRLLRHCRCRKAASGYSA